MTALNILLQYFIDFLIWMIKCEPNEGVVRTTFGANPKQYLKPGPYLRIPIVHDITSVNITEQVLELRPQSIETDDGYSLLVSGLLRYVVESPIKAVFNVENWESSLEVVTVNALRAHIRKVGVEINTDVIVLDVAPICEKWGVKIINLSIADLTTHSAHRIVGDASVLPIEEDDE